MRWYANSKEDVLDRLKSSESGLKDWQIKERQKEFGKNQIKTGKRKSKFILFLKQFNSWLIYILILAGIISVVIGHSIDAIVIFAIVILNSIIGFVQEYKAEEIIEKLKKSLVYKVSVLRQGKQQEIDSKNLVPGDIVKLEEGDKVPADCYILELENLQVNEAILTGESFPVDKIIGKLKKSTVLAERKNMLYAGTTLVKGNCLCVVVETGKTTEFGKLAELVEKTQDAKMPLEEKLDSFSKKISIAVLGFIVIAFFVGIYSGIAWVEMFMTSISLAVGAIPEGLPAIIAITLAVAIKRMYKSNTLIRKLPAAETLGRATVICTDKTGTLTEEELQVDKVFVSDKYYNSKSELDEGLKKILRIGILCNNARDEYDKILGDPTEASLIKFAKKFGFDKKKETEEHPRVKEYVFNSERKMMSIIRGNGKKISYVKGAPNVILERSSFEFFNGEVRKINKNRRKELHKIYESLAEKGLRVLGFAYKEVKGISQSSAENDLVFVGYQGMIDPPRKEVKDAIQQAMQAGIEIKVITGDAALTTKAIVEKIGLKGEAIEGKELDRLNNDEWYKIVKEKTIFARVTPQQKLKIVEILKEQKETIAVTGDGVNDILALKKADIGVSMGLRGADTSRDASDMVLLDDNFASIIAAVKEGRTVFDNLKKSIKFLLAANLGEVLIVVLTLFLGLPLPLVPLAILWMNLVTDSLPALALAVEPSEADVMKKPRKGELLTGIWKFTLAAGVLAFLTVFFVFRFGLNNYGLEIARTMAITCAIMFQMYFVFSCKSDSSIFKTGIFNNKYLIYAILVSIGLQMLAVYTLLGNLFGFVPLSLNQLVICFVSGLTGIVFFETSKLFGLFNSD